MIYLITGLELTPLKAGGSDDDYDNTIETLPIFCYDPKCHYVPRFLPS